MFLFHLDMPIQQSQELFRPTGQSPKPISSDAALESLLVTSTTPEEGGVSPRPHRNTFSEDEEEERTTGSGVDVIASVLGDGDGDDQSELSGTSPRGGSAMGVTKTASGLTLDSRHSTEAGGSDVKSEPPSVVGDGPEGEGEGEVKKEEEEAGEKEKSLEEDKEMEELLRVNPSYAKYVIERRRQAEQLRQRSDY